LDRILHLLTAIIVFVFVLFITFYTTRWVAGFAKKQQYNRNIELIETFKIAQNKHIAIIRVAKDYLVIGVGKDEISILDKLQEEDIDLKETRSANVPDFSALIDKARLRIKNRNDSDGGAV